MFFAISKILFFVLMPAWWLVFLLIWLYFAKNPRVKKRIRIAMVLICIIFTNPLLFDHCMIAWQPEPVTLPANAKYEAAVVLGGLSDYDKYNRGYFGGNADRFIQTANLYHMGIVKKIIISGGSGLLIRKVPAEAIFLREQFRNNGIPDSSIFSENLSRNTYENALYTRKLMDSMQVRGPVVLVTSAMHMPRSEHVFRKAGIAFIAFPCDYKRAPKPFTISDIVPEFSTFSSWQLFLKEMVGLAIYKLTGKA